VNNYLSHGVAFHYIFQLTENFAVLAWNQLHKKHATFTSKCSWAATINGSKRPQ